MNSIFVWTLSDVIWVVFTALIVVLFFLAAAIDAFAVWKRKKKRAAAIRARGN